MQGRFKRLRSGAARKMEAIMGELTDKIKGGINDAIGNAKEAIGKGTDNHELEAEGKAQQLKGDADKAKGSVKGALGDNV
jgi:uncharacterized protein YjbJ (UPF0337 family)